jgi:protein gp37
MAETKIEWTDRVWNPVTGCTKVSQGCRNCYAETIANHFWSRQYPPNPDGSPRKFTDVRIHPGRIDEPLKWKKSARVFVNSMSDLFHPEVPLELIVMVWQTMARAHWHTFQILTKRPQRMLEFTRWIAGPDDISVAKWPRNVWLGVSVENQQGADERIPLLLQTPAAVRFVSCEPLLGPVDLEPYLQYPPLHENYKLTLGTNEWRGLDWVIVGGESGPNARPMHPDWARSIRDQCQAAGVPFFFKQHGEWLPQGDNQNPNLVRSYKDGEHTAPLIHPVSDNGFYTFPDGTIMNRVGKKAAGRLLDDREWNEYPEVL